MLPDPPPAAVPEAPNAASPKELEPRESGLSEVGLSESGLGIRELATIAWRRKGWIAASLAVSLSLGAAYFVRAERLYQVSARLLVETQGLPMAAAPEQREKEFLATQAEIIGSSAVVAPAAEAVRWPTPLAPDASPTRALLAALDVHPVMGTHVISVAYRSHDIPHALAAVEGVIGSYRRYLQQSEQDSSLETLRLLAASEKELRGELQNLESSYRELRKASPVTGNGKNGADVQLMLVQQLGQKLTDMRNHRVELENQLEATQSWELARRESLARRETPAELAPHALAPDALAPHALAPHALASYALPVPPPRSTASERLITATMLTQMTQIDSTELHALQAQLSEAELREQELAERFGHKHAELRAVREQVRALNAALHDSLEAAPEILQRQLTAVQASEQRLSELYAVEQSKAKEIDAYLLQEQQARDQIARVHLLHDSLLTQLRQTELASQAVSEGRSGVKVTVLEAPTAPSSPLWPSPLILGLVCTAVGLALAGGLILFAEYRRPTFPGALAPAHPTHP
ncbi:GumC family protein [Candidatus Laterigemmans baculatus]|uniref:GumC family protein n=1 Tax=Candidatus Laterigemmans baculatus TaxID=2770505 RepID=UPI0013DCAF29|nr:Wzz/FepE/Etk N-terminal domain-containing protein [Candidatus Laterigemmans baculatus]